MPASIRITLTPGIERILKELKDERFGLLEPAEIIRVVLSEYDAARRRQTNREAIQIWQNNLPRVDLSEEDWQVIDQARKEQGLALTRKDLWKAVKSP